MEGMTKYYVDSCIWLNLLNRERTIIQGLPVWKIAEEFLKQKKGNIVVSEKIIREISDKIDKEQVQEMAKYAETVEMTREEYAFAQESESKEDYNLSFFDCMHIAMCTKKNLILVTRDRELITRGNKYVLTAKPEQFMY